MTTLARPRLRSAWRPLLPPLLLLLAALIVLYRDTAESMVTIWSRSDTFAHAFLVPPIVAWLIWRRRDRLAEVSPRPVGWVLLLMAAVSFVWLLGELAETNSVPQLAFTVLLVLAVPALAGMAATRAMLFPLAFLFFAVPIGEFMLPQLMNWTADFAVLALRLTGIPVYREGLRLVIPSGTWSVVEVHLVGVNKAELPRWQGMSLSNYWSPSGEGRTPNEQYTKIVRLGAGSTTVTTVNGGVVGLTRTLVEELKPIRVNSIHPGVVGDSPYWAEKAAARERYTSETPLGRLATMSEIVDATVFLLENTAVNGVDLIVDGGWHCR